ncbi:MAG: hypothetical protein HC859_09545, partial [Bacteroidia bacterium]|nr:hypothetical protein [Bacteroidia bacterium]
DVTLSDDSVNEGNALGAIIGNFTASDADGGDSFVYELIGGDGDTDNNQFSVDGMRLLANIVTDFENRQTYSIRIRVTDRGGLTFQKSFVIIVTDVNESPVASNVSIAIDENPDTGLAITTVNAVDPEGQLIRFDITSGNTDNAFYIDPFTGLLTVLNQAAIDFETTPFFAITVLVTDTGGLSATSLVEIQINNVNESPTAIGLSNLSISENTLAPGFVGILTGDDPDEQEVFTFALVSGAGDSDNAAFQIVDNELVLSVVPDFETQDTYLVRVQVRDNGGLTFEQAFIVNVLDLNDPPVVLGAKVSIDENASSGTVLVAMPASDPEGAILVYAIGSGNIENAFVIDPGTGQVTVANSGALDFETHTKFNLVIVATDPLGLSGSGILEILVNDVNETPTDILLDNASFTESSSLMTAIGSLSAADVDANDTHIFALVPGIGDSDNNLFTLIGAVLITNSYFNYEMRTVYGVRVRVTDAAGNTFEKPLALTVTDFNENLLLFIPTVFSPNGDGMNDTFLVRSDEMADVVFSIYSPSLGLIYDTHDVTEATVVGWDGTHDGKQVLPGAYIWKISGHFRDGKLITFKGSQTGTIVLTR